MNRGIQSEGTTSPQGVNRSASDPVREAFIVHAEELLRTICGYVSRGGFVSHAEVAETAQEIFDELFIIAHKKSKEFDPSRRPLPWLLGIAANLVKQHRDRAFKNKLREPRIRDAVGQAEGWSDEELFDRFSAIIPADTQHRLEANELLERIFSGLSEGDQEILRLAHEREMDGAEIACELGITQGAARVRLNQALQRARSVWRKLGEFDYDG